MIAPAIAMHCVVRASIIDARHLPPRDGVPPMQMRFANSKGSSKKNGEVNITSGFRRDRPVDTRRGRVGSAVDGCVTR